MKKLIEGQDDSSSDFPIASGMVFPTTICNNTSGNGNVGQSNSSDESAENRSKSGANLMQQLQLMGLAGNLPPGLNLNEIALNGGNMKNELEQQPLTPKSSPEKSPGNNKDNSTDQNNDNMFPYNMYSNLQGYYAATGTAAAFLHPSMYNPPTGRNKL